MLARVVAVTFCMTFAASLAARLGPISMAAFQPCLQIWLTSSLLADGLAVAVQVHIYFKNLSAAASILVMSSSFLMSLQP